jgi:TonB family protein
MNNVTRSLTGLICAGIVLLGSLGGLAQENTPAVRRWLSKVISKIDKTDQAQTIVPGKRKSGTVMIRVRVAADGHVNGVEVERSSGSPSLDERAVAAVRAADPFDPPPATLLTSAGVTELSFPLQLGR